LLPLVEAVDITLVFEPEDANVSVLSKPMFFDEPIRSFKSGEGQYGHLVSEESYTCPLEHMFVDAFKGDPQDIQNFESGEFGVLQFVHIIVFYFKMIFMENSI